MRSVYSGTVARQSGPRDYDAMEKQSPILLAFERFKPVETESILRDRGAWQRKMILATHQY